MKIAIDGSRAFVEQRTGIEEYSYRVIKHLRNHLEDEKVILYLRQGQKVSFDLPESWKIKIIRWPFPLLWTQIGLSLEMLLNPVDVLFVSAHTVPFIHPKNTIVTIHGLEYEFLPDAYSAWERFYMRRSIRKSCTWAKKIIAVSENTKNDLMNFYKVSEEKIAVIYEGPGAENTSQIPGITDAEQISEPYLFFIGRIEERKNIAGIVKAFEILKQEYNIPHKLLFAGKPGFGYARMKALIEGSSWSSDIILAGFISGEEKWQYLTKADVFLFTTFYEGFGLPILEAQSAGVPVVASNIAAVVEIAGQSAVLVDPNEPQEIAERTNVLIKENDFRDDIIRRGYENVKRFSWDKCAEEIAGILTKNDHLF